MDTKRIVKKMESFTMYNSLLERRKREYRHHEKEVIRLKNLSALELQSEYIKAKSDYEYVKTTLYLLVIPIIVILSLIILIIGWYYYNYYISIPAMVGNVIISNKFMSQVDAYEIGRTLFILLAVIVTFITFILFLSLMSYAKRRGSLYKYWLLVEHISSECKKTTEGSLS